MTAIDTAAAISFTVFQAVTAWNKLVMVGRKAGHNLATLSLRGECDQYASMAYQLAGSIAREAGGESLRWFDVPANAGLEDELNKLASALWTLGVVTDPVEVCRKAHLDPEVVALPAMEERLGRIQRDNARGVRGEEQMFLPSLPAAARIVLVIATDTARPQPLIRVGAALTVEGERELVLFPEDGRARCELQEEILRLVQSDERTVIITRSLLALNRLERCVREGLICPEKVAILADYGVQTRMDTWEKFISPVIGEMTVHGPKWPMPKLPLADESDDLFATRPLIPR